eukprot:gene1190-605_t
MDGQYVTYYFQFVPIVKQTVTLMLIIHILTCLWMRVTGPETYTYVQALYLCLY